MKNHSHVLKHHPEAKRRIQELIDQRTKLPQEIADLVNREFAGILPSPITRRLVAYYVEQQQPTEITCCPNCGYSLLV